MQSKISELIKKLQDAQERFGDTDVTYEGLWSIGNTGDPNDYIYLEMYDRIRIIQKDQEIADLRRKVEQAKKELNSLNLSTGSFEPDYWQQW